MYEICFAEDVKEDLAAVPQHERRRILDFIDLQLRHEPARQTRNRKILAGLVPPWDHMEPVWELRVGEYRVFYDVDEAARLVSVRAIRRKPAHRTTEEIL